MERNDIKVKKYDINKPRKKPVNKKKVSKEFVMGIIVAAIIISVIAVIVLLPKNDNEQLEKPKVEQPTEEVHVEETNRVEVESEIVESSLKKEPPLYLQEYLNQNEYTIGYIKIDDTQIDYPVVQTDNNEYYMSHNFNFDEDKAGTIFMDYRCDIDDFSKTRNVILYGHRMKDGSMFKGLVNYENKDFFLSHKIIKFDTLNEELEWKVFAVFETTTDFYYIDTEFPYDEMWIYFLEQCKEKSIYDTLDTFYNDDIVLTLSTCSTKEDERFVVMAKLIK